MVLGLRERAEQRIPLQELGYTLQIVQHSQASKGDIAPQVCMHGPFAAQLAPSAGFLPSACGTTCFCLDLYMQRMSHAGHHDHGLHHQTWSSLLCGLSPHVLTDLWAAAGLATVQGAIRILQEAFGEPLLTEGSNLGQGT